MSFWLHDARAFAEALFSDSHGPPPRDRLDWLISELDDFAKQAGPRVRAILVGGLMTTSWVAPTLVRKAPPLARLDLRDRIRALEALEASPLGLPLLAVKAILCIIYYEHPDVLRDAGIISASEERTPCLH